MRDLDLAFAHFYSILTALAHLLAAGLCFVSLGPSAESIGLTLAAPPVLAVIAVVEVAKVALAKHLSGHSAVFALPQYANPVRGDPTKGPLLRRTVLRFKKLVFLLWPYKNVANGIVLLLAAWLLVAYATVCFGAPFFSQHLETAGFATLLTVLSVLPSLLVYGPDMTMLGKVAFQSGPVESDPLTHALFQNGFGAIAGAWFGAFPIPLDWDRPWQAWPITCCIGAFAGSVLVNLWTLVQLRRQCASYAATSSKIRKKS